MAAGASVPQNLRQAVGREGKFYWDFGAGQAKPAWRQWQQHCPEELHAELTRDLTAEELKSIRDGAGVDRVEPVPDAERPSVVICIGPAAAGKTTALPKAASMFGLDLATFVQIDGDDIREAHGGWRAVTGDDGRGFKDVYDIFVKNKKTKGMKNSLAKETISARKNVVFGWTSIEKEALQMMRDQNYKIHILGLLISLAESNARQMNRAQVNGRWATWPEKKVHAVFKDMATLAAEDTAEKVAIFESTDVVNMRLVQARGLVSDAAPSGEDFQATCARLLTDMSLEDVGSAVAAAPAAESGTGAAPGSVAVDPAKIIAVFVEADVHGAGTMTKARLASVLLGVDPERRFAGERLERVLAASGALVAEDAVDYKVFVNWTFGK